MTYLILCYKMQWLNFKSLPLQKTANWASSSTAWRDTPLRSLLKTRGTINLWCVPQKVKSCEAGVFRAEKVF